jgi:hypothetical protein
VFSPIVFATEIDENFQPVNPAVEFSNPLTKIYGTYSYNFMDNGVQWTELWYRGDTLLKAETGHWEGGTGGYGVLVLELPSEEWLPGEYQVQCFVGSQWILSGYFTVVGNPPTATFTPSPTFTLTPTPTPTPTRTATPTRTSVPSNTPKPSVTPQP